MNTPIIYNSQQYFPIENSVLVGGCFDLLHYGHLNFLKAAAQHGSVVVALESDESITAAKKSPPIHTQQQRAEILSELRCVQQIICLPVLTTYEDYLGLVMVIKPKVLAITEGDPQTENKKHQAKAVGAEIIVVNTLVDGLSSSLIRAKHL
ncbi:MAG: adenylyltransferase/cytidyltransferase family protein [Candidatus Paracaedibacteraceae bacterium]|nr:adenylyltransferase/cytidyltransferase family protein [Candidatus Paracaedibacteraceae bacterium]